MKYLSSFKIQNPKSKIQTWFFILFLLLFSFANAAELKLPDYHGFVNDFAGVIDRQTVQKVNSICSDLKKSTGAELAVVTVKNTSPLDSKTYAVKLLEKWGIGEKGKDNGVLFLISIEDRRVEIEVGYGLEGTITDAQAGEILDQYVIPSLKKSQTSEAVFLGAGAIAKKIGAGSVEREKPQTQTPATDGGFMYILIVIGIIVVISLVTRAGFSHFLGGVLGAIAGYYYINGIVGIIVGALVGFLFGTSVIMFGGWGGGGGGGFGGFGGGRSGGGGAGRDW